MSGPGAVMKFEAKSKVTVLFVLRVIETSPLMLYEGILVLFPNPVAASVHWALISCAQHIAHSSTSNFVFIAFK